MAESRPSVNYQISSGVLASMKSAAGNYLPNYGNWRFRVDPPKPEEPEEEPVKSEEVKEVEEKKVEPLEEVTPLEEPSTPPDDGKEIYTYDRLYQDWLQRTGSEAEAKQKVADAKKFNEGKYGTHNPTTEGITDNYLLKEGEEGPGVGTDFQEGWTGDENSPVMPESWTHVNQDPTKNPSGAGYNVKSAMPFLDEEEEVQEVPEVDLYSDVDEMLAASVSNYNGASKNAHGHIENIVRGYKEKHNTGDKRAQTDAHMDLATLADNVARDVGPDGSIKNLYDIVNENILSESTLKEEKYVIKELLEYLNVVPGITEDGGLIHRVPMPDGGILPVDNKYIEDLAVKRVIQYSLGAEFDKAKGDFLASGEAGNQWNPIMEDSIQKKNLSIFRKNPDTLASCILDEGIFFSGSLADRMKEKYSPDADIDMKELVYEASQDKELYNELVEDAAWALTMAAKESVDMGYSTHLKNNGGDTALDAQSLLDKYA